MHKKRVKDTPVELDKPSGVAVDLSEAQLQRYAKLNVASVGLAAARQFVSPNIGVLSLALYIYTAIPYMKDVEKSLLKDRKVNVNVLFFVADALTLAISQYFTAAVGVWLMNSGKMSVAKAKDMTEKMITDVFEQLPQEVWLLVDNAEIKVPLEDVEVDDILVVNTGEVIPVDGIITEGLTTIDQHALTGESQPAEKGPGDTVLVSTVVISGRILIKVEKSGQDTTVSKIGQILFNSTSFKSKTQLKGEKWADKATLPMLGMSIVMLPALGPVNTAVFINSHIGNRIRVLAPLITLNHIAWASQKGILIKDGRAIEGLSDIDTVLFDKTGTLTAEVPEISNIYNCDRYNENEVLRYVAAAERKLTHPIARAIVKKAEEAHLVLPDIHDSKYHIGYGITVHLDKKVIRVGSSRFITDQGIRIPENIKEAEKYSHAEGNSMVFVAVDKRACGAIELKPQIRPEAKNIVQELKQRGVKYTAIISGDHKHPTQKLAEELGVDDYFSDTLPEGKAGIVEQLQKEGRSVCFVGDGINDAIAMKLADVSISILGATAIATDMAEIVFMDGTMSNMCELFDISKRLEAKLKKSLTLTITPGVINLSGAFLFHYGILTSLIINTTFAGLGMKDALMPLKDLARKK